MSIPADSVYNKPMKALAEDLKTGQLQHVYLLYGEEDYLIRQYRGRLRDALVSADDAVNVTYFEGREIDPAQIIDQAETMPFFAEHRSLFIDDSGFFKKGGEALADYMAEIPPTAYLIFSEREVDRRSRLFKAVKQAGRAVEFPRQSEDTIQKWVLGRIAREGKKISRPVLERFLAGTGNDMDRIANELEKLLSYTMGRDVLTAEDVEAVCVTHLEDRIFDMVDAIANRQQERALELYYDLLMLREPPMRILALITRQFRILTQLSEMADEGRDRRSMAAQVKVPEFAVRKYLSQARQFTPQRLRQAVRDGVQAEENIKAGQMNDRLAVELLLITYSW